MMVMLMIVVLTKDCESLLEDCNYEIKAFCKNCDHCRNPRKGFGFGQSGTRTRPDPIATLLEGVEEECKETDLTKPPVFPVVITVIGTELRPPSLNHYQFSTKYVDVAAVAKISRCWEQQQLIYNLQNGMYTCSTSVPSAVSNANWPYNS